MADIWYDKLGQQENFHADGEPEVASNYPQSMINAAKAMKNGEVGQFLSKKANLIKGGAVGGVLGLGVGLYTKKHVLLFSILGMTAGLIYSTIDKKPKKAKTDISHMINLKET